MSKLEELIRELCPNGVQYCELKEIADISTGSHNTNEGVESGMYPFYVRSQEPLTLNSYDYDETAIITAGDGVGVGKVFHFVNGKYALHQRAYRIHANTTKVEDKFLYYYFCTNFMKYIEKTMFKGSVPSIRRPMLNAFKIPVPPLEVQQEIIHLLDDFTAKTAELQNKINEELEARKKQYECYKDMLLNNSENFIITTIGNISESVTVGIANSATQAYSETGVTMLRNQNIKENYLDDNDLIYINNVFSMKYKNKLLKENDILVTRTGYPGVACVVPKKYESAQTFTTLIVRLQDLKKTNPKYVCYYINSLSGKQYVRKMQSGAAQQNFGATALSKMPINIPDITTQNYIVKIFENFDSTHSKISMTLLSELESRQKQYEFYRDKLLTFKELN